MCLLWILLILIIVPSNAKDHIEREKLVVRGVQVEVEQYPYTAQVIIDQSSMCGGAIISKRVVVTAAHCLYSALDQHLVSAFELDVYLGSSNTMDGTHHDVCKVVKHPNFGNNTGEDYYWDIGLILLTRSIKTSRRVQIATIAAFHHWRNVKNTMTIAGFGSTDNTNDLTKTLSVTRMKYVDSKICNMSQTGDGEFIPVPDHMFCMVGTTWTSDCRGDSGSAVTWRSYIVGLVSFGRDSRDGSCGSEAIPSMYTDLTYFRSWVEHNVRDLESITTKTCEDVELFVKLKKRKAAKH